MDIFVSAYSKNNTIAEEKAMYKYMTAQKGGTLMVVFGFIVTIAIVVTPLALSTNIGLLQAKTNGHKEIAYTEAHSAMTVFSRLYRVMLAEDEANNTEENIQLLVDEVSRLSGLNAELNIIWGDNNEPVAIRFTARAGSGNQIRESEVEFKLTGIEASPTESSEPTPFPTPTPVPTPTPIVTPTPAPTPGGGNKVIFSNTMIPENRKLFAACYLQPAIGQPLPTDHILNDYTDAQFREWFGDSADYYISQVDGSSASLVPFQDSRYSAASSIPNVITEGKLVITKTHSAIEHNGHLEIGSSKSQLDQDTIIQRDSEGYSVRAAGDLNFITQLKADMLFDGKVEVGGNLNVNAINNGNTLTFNDDVTVRGDVVLGQGSGDTVIFEGDLIIGGSLITGNSLNKLIVKGDLIVTDDVILENTVDELQVDGSIIIKGGFTAENTIHRFQIGEDVIIKGSMLFENTVGKTSGGVEGLFYVGGSMKIFGSLDMKNTLHGLVVSDDMIVNGNVTFHNTVNDRFEVGGTMAAGGDIWFDNTISKDVKIDIGENLITRSDLTLDKGLNGSMELGGYLLVFEDATLNAFDQDWRNNSMSGFYVGGETKFHDNYAKKWFVNDLDSGKREEIICING